MRDVSFSNVFHRVVACLALTVCLASSTSFAAADYDIGPAASWVKPVAVTISPLPPEKRNGHAMRHLLIDTQTHVGRKDCDNFRHFVSSAINSEGIDGVSQFTVSFDPEYQKLVLHTARRHRDGQVIDILDDCDIRLLQREQDLESRLYDGRETALVVMEDIRVGDVVDYSYTVSGQNPVFKGTFANSIALQWTVPIETIHHRLLWPSKRELYIKPRETQLEPIVTRGRSVDEYVWSVSNTPALLYDERVPFWFHGYARLDMSSVASWEDVIQWATPLYEFSPKFSQPLRKRVDVIRGAVHTPVETVDACLGFVQEEIRYTGYEMGAGSHAPSAPDTTFGRRFGDCKDKSLLLVAILRELGVEAYPALVHTLTGRVLDASLPSPTAFNHVIVRVILKGEGHWLDPTRTNQGGSLGTRVSPDYGHALVIGDGSKALTSMACEKRVYWDRHIEERYVFTDDTETVLDLTVTTVHSGGAAEAMRGTIRSVSTESLQKDYRDFYSRIWGEVTDRKLLEIDDNKKDNQITIREYYRIEDMWFDEKDGSESFGLYPYDVAEYLTVPAVTGRTMPLSLAHPASITHRTVLETREVWDLTVDHVAVTNDAFIYRADGEYCDRRLVLTKQYRSLRDHVSVEGVSSYADAVGQIRSGLNYPIIRGGDPADEIQGTAPFVWEVPLVLALSLAASLWLCIMIYRCHPPRPPAAEIDPALNGLRGWLILPAIGITLQPLILAVGVLPQVSNLMGSTWDLLTDPTSSSYIPHWESLVLAEVGCNVLRGSLAVLVVITFYKQMRVLPYLFIWTGILGLVVVSADLIVASMIIEHKAPPTPEGIGEVGRAFWHLVIWGSYFGLSKRVKATFLNHARPGPPAVPPEIPPPLPAKAPDAAEEEVLRCLKSSRSRSSR
jgi:transglutaminase-like putative cysteine protease